MTATLSLPRLIGWIALFVLVGFPLVGYLWETLNQLLAGVVDPARLVISVPVALVLVAVLVLLSRAVRGWEAERRTVQAAQRQG